MQPEAIIARRDHWRTRLRRICNPQVVHKALLAAGVVGTLLALLNQGDLLLAGQVTGRVVVKSLLTPVIPFCVTMLGAFLNTDATHAEDLRPGKAAIRRSLLIALCVGSTIILLNQGDVLLAGAASSPLVWAKVLVAPCVPFCVSLYGAYAAYWSALAEQQKATGIK